MERAWGLEADQLAQLLEVDPALGLSAAEVVERRRRYGSNALELSQRRSWLAILADQFKGLLVVLLAVAAGLSGVFGQWAEAIAVLVVLLLNAAIGFVTELRAVRSVEALRRLGDSHARVRRGGQLATVVADDLVPGDVLLVEGGDLVGADARLLKGSRLEADESSLTGESVPVAKETHAVDADATLPERTSMLHKGTAITRGAAEALVVATGMATELGRISRLVDRSPGGESTPLEKRLTELAQRLVWLTLIVATLITLTGLSSGKSWLVLLQTGIALAVAAVPEGLPIIATLTLAQGVRRMARRNALVSRLAAVETLGATSVILTDKTGTLTENRMRVATFWLPAGEVEMPFAFSADPERPDVAAHDTALVPAPGATGSEPLPRQLAHALAASALCVTAELPSDDGALVGRPPRGSEDVDRRNEAADGNAVDEAATEGVGDPMELALLRAAREAGIERDALLQRHPEVRQEAFDSDTRLMATSHRWGERGREWVVVKGAPGAVLTVASSLADEERTPLDDATRERWLVHNRELAARGLRVLALAERLNVAADASPYENLSFIGLVGLVDPPRPGIEAAIAGCRNAGIRVVMITGDQPITARNIAEKVGIVGADRVLDGRAVTRLFAAGEAGKRELLGANVLARVSPEQKLDIIKLHQQEGNIVAMTGDGVNDAPALRQADIGVAMGQRGTEVAREAADMVLLDDTFGTIVTAVKEGRVIFENIRAFVLYLLSCNLSEILVIGIAGVAGYPLPLLPLQILFLNLVTDVFPALALGAGRGDARILERPPRDSREPLLARRHWNAILGYGSVLTISTLAAFVIALEMPGGNTARAVTVAFLALALGQIWHVFNMREPGSSLFNNEVTRNRWVWAATLGCTILVVLAVVIPPLRQVLQVELLDATGWILVIAAGLAPLLLGQIGKAFGLGRLF